jgi:hypothetical protein
MIGGAPAVREGDLATCQGPDDIIQRGSATVFFGGRAAARRGDPTAHGGVIMAGCGAVWIGGTPAPTSDAETIAEAMRLIRTSEFAKTPKGREVLRKLEEMLKSGHIRFSKTSNRGELAPPNIVVSDIYNRDPQETASELVHEGTHALRREHDIIQPKNSIDEEVDTNTTQLDFYEEQRSDGFRDRDLEGRRDVRAEGRLREDVRRRYPGAPEHG